MRKIHIVAYYKGVDPKYLNEEIEKLAAKHGNIVEASLCELDNKVILTAHTEKTTGILPELGAGYGIEAIEEFKKKVVTKRDQAAIQIGAAREQTYYHLDESLTPATKLLVYKRSKQLRNHATIEQDAVNRSDRSLIQAARAFMWRLKNLDDDGPIIKGAPLYWPEHLGPFKFDPDPIENLINAAACLVAEADRRYYIRQHGKE